MNDIRTLRRADYARYVSPRQPAPKPLTTASDETGGSDTVTISIRLSLPRFHSWKLYGFVRQYPYVSIVAAAVALIGLVIAGDALTWLWHAVHNGGLRG